MELDESASDFVKNKVNLNMKKLRFESEEEKLKSGKEKTRDNRIRNITE